MHDRSAGINPSEDFIMRNFPVYAMPGLLDDVRLWQNQAARLSPVHPFFTASPESREGEFVSHLIFAQI